MPEMLSKPQEVYNIQQRKNRIRVKEGKFFFLLLFNYSCPHFLPGLSPALPHLPQSILPPLSLSRGPLYMFLDWTLPLLSPVISLCDTYFYLTYAYVVLTVYEYFSKCFMYILMSFLLHILFCWLRHTQEEIQLRIFSVDIPYNRHNNYKICFKYGENIK